MTATPRKKSNTRSAASNQSGERESSKPFRAALPPLDGRADAAADRELDAKIFALVTAVAAEDGRTYPPEWLAVADAAKRRGYVDERGLKLYLKKHGQQWLDERARAATGERALTMTKLTPRALLELKDLSHDTGVIMQEAISEIISTVHENRDALTRIARRHGLEHPWEAIGKLVRESK